MFLMYGPNTNHGSGSVPYTLECQFNYVIDAIRRMRAEGLRWIDVKPEVQARWRAEIDERSRDTVWTTGGCTSGTRTPRAATRTTGSARGSSTAGERGGSTPATTGRRSDGRKRRPSSSPAARPASGAPAPSRSTAEGFHVLAGVRKEADGEALRRAAGAEPVIVDVTDAATIEALARARSTRSTAAPRRPRQQRGHLGGGPARGSADRRVAPPVRGQRVRAGRGDEGPPPRPARGEGPDRVHVVGRRQERHPAARALRRLEARDRGDRRLAAPGDAAVRGRRGDHRARAPSQRRSGRRASRTPRRCARRWATR